MPAPGPRFVIAPCSRAFRRNARRGSILVAVVVAFFVFAAAYVAFAGAQANHARRVWADYGKLQATYAAESGVHAAFARNADVATTVLWTDGANSAQYAATRASTSTPTWITATGSCVFGGETYVSTVRGYHVGNQILLWDFEP